MHLILIASNSVIFYLLSNGFVEKISIKKKKRKENKKKKPLETNLVLNRLYPSEYSIYLKLNMF